MSKTIFITGASKGFGRLWTEALLERGDNVAATSRNTGNLEDLKAKYGDRFLPLQLDITNKQQVTAAVNAARSHFGRVDVVINNAGYGVFGAVEEVSEENARQIFDTNVFGTLWVTQAALPVLREQGSGHIIQLSSVLGVWTLPNLGIYNATKFAVEGLSESLASEVSDLGIKVTIIEPNGYTTEFGGESAIYSDPISAYDALRTKLSQNQQPGLYGRPEATVPAVLKLIDSENPPLRLFLGKVGLARTEQVYAEKLDTWKSWNEISVAAHG
ncbi:SDR family NAD(P)-dependent oxidoreductase [Pedobacter sp. JY14-1]|uniref:SDR family NAD(P)-dependent oxidoreductase n=1 Tax=Pedobacter sp. JY14-1 TaxID=3034151 RepID=UPI0023E33861|nr:SDR family NAD(P)-dependent oxidoreductase [Pedobacter sp. JY14-1]